VLTASALRGALSAALGPDTEVAGHIAALQQQRLWPIHESSQTARGCHCVAGAAQRRPGWRPMTSPCISARWRKRAPRASLANGWVRRSSRSDVHGDLRMAPANDIARQLVAAGVPDAPMQVYTAGLKGCLVLAVVLQRGRADLSVGDNRARRRNGLVGKPLGKHGWEKYDEPATRERRREEGHRND